MSEVEDLKSEVGERRSRGTPLNLTPVYNDLSFITFHANKLLLLLLLPTTTTRKKLRE